MRVLPHDAIYRLCRTRRTAVLRYAVAPATALWYLRDADVAVTAGELAVCSATWYLLPVHHRQLLHPPPAPLRSSTVGMVSGRTFVDVAWYVVYQHYNLQTRFLPTWTLRYAHYLHVPVCWRSLARTVQPVRSLQPFQGFCLMERCGTTYSCTPHTTPHTAQAYGGRTKFVCAV